MRVSSWMAWLVGAVLLGVLALGWWGWRLGGLPLLQLGMPLC